MRTVSVHTAKTQLESLINAAAMGEEIVITKSGRPVAKLAPLSPFAVQRKRTLGLLTGKAVIPTDFNAPLPPDVIDRFESR